MTPNQNKPKTEAEDPMKLFGHLPDWKRDMKVKKWREEKAKLEANEATERSNAVLRREAVFSNPDVCNLCLVW